MRRLWSSAFMPGDTDVMQVPILDTILNQVDKTIRFSWLEPNTWVIEAVQPIADGAVNMDSLSIISGEFVTL